MEIKLKLNEVVNINNTLSAIIDDSKAKINILLKFRLLGIMNAIKPLIANFEIVKNEKIMEFGKETKDGIYQISKDDKKSMAKFRAEIEKVLDSEVSITVESINPEEIIDKGLKSEYLIGLYPIIRQY